MNNSELLRALSDFSIKALACVRPSIKDLTLRRFRLHNGASFTVSDEAFDAQVYLVQKIIKKLGPVRSHRKVLDKLLWDFVTSIEDPAQLEDKKFLNEALVRISDLSSKEIDFYAPCPMVKMPEELDCLTIGPVSIQSGKYSIEILNEDQDMVRFCEGSNWNIVNSFNAEAGKIFISFPFVVLEGKTIGRRPS